MTKVKLDSSIGGGPASALEPLVPGLYAKPGVRILGVVELHHTERTQPAPDSESEPAVKLRISSLEIAGRDQEPHLREALRALYLQRTAVGTLSEDGQIELSKGTLERTAGVLSYVEVSRLRAGLDQWAVYARRAASNQQTTLTQLHNELKTLGEGLTALLGNSGLDSEDDA